MNSPNNTFAHLGGFLSAAADYFKARFQFLAVEGKSAGLRYAVALAMGVGGLVVAVLGYIFFVITAVFGIAAAWDWRHSWIVVLGITALLHLGGAAGLVLLARNRFKAGSFEGTIAELKKDQQWLTQLTKRN